jgi:hypothetical protein
MGVDDFAVEPAVLCADGPFVLLAVTFICYPTRPPVCVRPDFSEYFLYKAGPGKPSLELIPGPHVYRRFQFRNEEVGILHCGDDQFVIAVLELSLANKGCWNYDLHLFSRKSNVWVTKPVTRDLSCDWDPARRHSTHKVVNVGGGKLGWVDLRRGILVCDDADPFVRFTALPDPMESNKDDLGDTCPRAIRDISCTNGSFKFVEMEFLGDSDDDDDDEDGDGENDDDDGNVDDDDDDDKDDNDDDVKNDKDYRDYWTATVWMKTLSGDWHILHSIDVVDISVSTSHSDVVPELWDDKAMKPSLTKLLTASPALSLLDDSVVYMMCKVNFDDPRAWMISIDMRTREVIQIFPFCADRVCNVTVNYHPFSFSSYVNAS